MSRLVRRAPLLERVKAYLNPLDFVLWLYEEVDSNDWEEFQKAYSTPIGLSLNVIFLVARANSGYGGRRSRVDDVFGDDTGTRGRFGWLSWFASFIAHLLALFSILNATYTFWRKRHYRLFESSVDVTPTTPSAHRVRVDSSPVSSSPLRFLSNMIASTTAEARSHPDPTRDVWELAVWDPFPLCLRLFCLFSPGHVLVYWLFLPTTSHDSRPSTTVLTTMLLGALLSIQLFVLQSSFSQQNKDTALIHREVLNEYDTKFVHPRTTPLVRDVGTQYDADIQEFGSSARKGGGEVVANFVHTYTPTVLINRGFKTYPNPNYSKHYDPENVSEQQHHRHHHSSRAPTPATIYQTPSAYTYDQSSSPIRNHKPVIRQPQFYTSGPSTTTTTTSTGDGGSLGIFSHANSPLKKATSMNFHPTDVGLKSRTSSSTTSGFIDNPRSQQQQQQQQQPRSRNHHRPTTATVAAAGIKREGSPLKKSIVPSDLHPHQFPGSGSLAGGVNGQRMGGGGRSEAAGSGLGNRRETGYF